MAPALNNRNTVQQAASLKFFNNARMAIMLRCSFPDLALRAGVWIGQKNTETLFASSAVASKA